MHQVPLRTTGELHPPHALCVVERSFLGNVLCRFLAECAYKVKEALSTREASDVVNSKQEAFDLIIIDGEIAGGGAVGLAKEVRNAGCNGQIIMLCRNSDPAEIQACEQLDVDRISKPVDLRKLMERIPTPIA